MGHVVKQRKPRSDRLTVRRSVGEHPSPTPLDTPCRLWQGSISQGTGYGRICHDGVVEHAHRWVMRDAGEDITGRPWDSALHVLHMCDQPLCFRWEHLRLGTQTDNMRDAKAKGRVVPPPVRRGEANNKACLTAADVVAIREIHANGDRSLNSIARQFNVTRKSITNVLSGRTWKHVPYSCANRRLP